GGGGGNAGGGGPGGGGGARGQGAAWNQRRRVERDPIPVERQIEPDRPAAQRGRGHKIEHQEVACRRRAAQQADLAGSRIVIRKRPRRRIVTARGGGEQAQHDRAFHG